MFLNFLLAKFLKGLALYKCIITGFKAASINSFLVYLKGDNF